MSLTSFRSSPSASGQMTCPVVRLSYAVQRHLSRGDFRLFEHSDVFFRHQITVGGDARTVFCAMLVGKRDQPGRERSDDIRRCQRFSSEPAHIQFSRSADFKQTPGKLYDIILHFYAHQPLSVLFKTIRAVEIAAHRRADRETDRTCSPAAHAPGSIDRRQLLRFHPALNGK